jgi:hypothetical protein
LLLFYVGVIDDDDEVVDCENDNNTDNHYDSFFSGASNLQPVTAEENSIDSDFSSFFSVC